MATNYATASYQEVYDLGTSDNKISIIGIHSPCGISTRRMLGGFFSQFRFVKYLGATCSFHAVQRLIADVDKVGGDWEAGKTIDPRDLINPIIFKGCHGENLNSILNAIYENNNGENSGFIHHSRDQVSRSDEFNEESLNEKQLSMSIPGVQDVLYRGEEFYYSLLSDKSFKKYAPMSSFKLPNLYPLVHTVGTRFPMYPNSALPNEGRINENGSIVSAGGIVVEGWSNEDYSTTDALASNYFMTTGLKKLGFLPTRSWYSANKLPTAPDNDKANVQYATYIPRIFMGVLVMPPSYKQQLYYRVVITHHFAFKGFTTALSGCNNNQAINPLQEGDQMQAALVQAYHNWLPDNVQFTDENSLDGINVEITKTTEGVS